MRAEFARRPARFLPTTSVDVKAESHQPQPNDVMSELPLKPVIALIRPGSARRPGRSRGGLGCTLAGEGESDAAHDLVEAHGAGGFAAGGTAGMTPGTVAEKLSTPKPNTPIATNSSAGNCARLTYAVR